MQWRHNKRLEWLKARRFCKKIGFTKFWKFSNCKIDTENIDMACDSLFWENIKRIFQKIFYKNYYHYVYWKINFRQTLPFFNGIAIWNFVKSCWFCEFIFIISKILSKIQTFSVKNGLNMLDMNFVWKASHTENLYNVEINKLLEFIGKEGYFQKIWQIITYLNQIFVRIFNIAATASRGMKIGMTSFSML